MADHPSAFRLEAWHAGVDDREIAVHVDGCGECRAYVDSLASARQALHARIAPDDFARQVRRAADEPIRLRWRWPALLAVGAAAALLLLFLPRGTAVDPPQADRVLLKGNVSLAVIVQRGDQQDRRLGIVPLQAGDRIRLELISPEARRYVVGILEDGAWTPLESRRFPAGRHLLEASFTVDVEPGTSEVLAGDPAAVEHAVKTGARDGVAHVRLDQNR